MPRRVIAMKEIEAKLEAPSVGELHALPRILGELGYDAMEPERRMTVDHYLDTDDLDLRGRRWALRLRDLGTRKLITLKALVAPEGGVASREEHEEQIDWGGGDMWNFPAEVLGGRVAELVGDGTLHRLFVVHQERLQFHVAGEGLWVEASLDAVRWECGDEVARGYTAELELHEGEETQLREMLARVREATGWKAGGGSKYETGLRVAGLA